MPFAPKEPKGPLHLSKLSDPPNLVRKVKIETNKPTLELKKRKKSALELMQRKKPTLRVEVKNITEEEFQDPDSCEKATEEQCDEEESNVKNYSSLSIK